MATDAEVQSVAANDADEHQKLKKLGKYVVQRRLGAGGMGTVFLAIDSELQRTVALKVLPKERARNPKLVQRFKSEGQAAAKLEHDNIVKVYEAGEINGFLYIALEYVDGADVEELVRKRTFLPVKRSIDIIRQITRALEHANEKGIVHRDIKPSNLMIRKDGQVKLADMGLARAIDDTTETSITQPGMTVGTVDYMAPEQGRDSKLADIRSDIYSLGCTWYHMLTGSPPFPEGSVTGKMSAHASKPPPNPRSINKNVPEAVVAVMHRMMAKEPKHRYQTPQELLVDLNRAMLGRNAVEADVLAGLAEAQSDWDLPVAADPVGETADGRPAATSAGNAAKPPVHVSQKMKTKSRRRGKDDAGAKPRRSARNAPPQQGEGKSRELPPRSRNPEQLGMSQKKLDLDRLKILVIIFVGVCVVGGVSWAVMRMNSSMDDIGTGGTLNPYQAEAAEPPDHSAVGSGRPATPGSEDPPTLPDGDGGSEGPTAQLNQYQQVELFAGADRTEDVPQWLIDARAGLAGEFTRMVVSLDETVAADHRSITAALDRLPAAGGIIELSGRGPFPLPPRALENRAHVTIRAAAGSRPVVFLQATDAAPQWLAFSGDTLVLSGVHLVASGRDLAVDAPAIHVVSGTLLMRDSSLTVTDPAAHRTVAVQLGARDSTGANCLLENTFLRGSQLTAVLAASSAVNVLAGNSLVLSGDAPAISLQPDDVPPRVPADARELVTVSLFATVVASRNAVFSIAVENPERAPRVELLGRQSLFGAESPLAVWMRVSNWPENESGGLSSSRARGIRWDGEQFALLGWSELIRFQSPQRTEPLAIVDEDEWRRFWSVASESRSFIAGELQPPGVAIDRVVPDDVVARIDALLASAAADRSAFGLEPGALPTLPESLIDRLRAESNRPRVPSRFSVAGGRTVTFDLSQGANLDRFVNSAECPDGAIVELKGNGSQIRPFVLRNKSLRLVFPAGDDAVVLRPIQATAGERPEAFIRVEGGSIDLVNAQLTIPSSARAVYPTRVLQVIDGNLTLDGCIFTGQFRDGAQDVPIVEWTRGTADAPRFASISNSLIAGRFEAVSADLSNGLLDCVNCVFTSLGDALELSDGSAPAPGYAHFANCTFSAGDSAFLVNTRGDAQRPRIHCFVKRCVFAPPPESSADGCVLLTHSADAPEDGSIVWWESHNGFAPPFRRFHQAVDATAAGTQNIETDWVRLWGGDHVWHPLTGPTAVLLADRLPEPDRVEPGHFALAANSLASTWGPGGQPIGASVGAIGPNAQAPERTSPSASGPRRSSTANDPGF